MNIRTLSELPEWNDESGDGDPRQVLTFKACKALYIKWNEILVMLSGCLGALEDLAEEAEGEESFVKDQKALILSDAYDTGAKIRGSEAGNMYIVRMENASIIRKNVQFIKSFISGLIIEGEVDKEHAEVIRNEIDVFRELFKHWVSTFKKDDFTDEWGLFI